MVHLSKTALQRHWVILTVLLTVQIFQPAFGSVIRERQSEVNNEEKLSGNIEVVKSHHLQKRNLLSTGLKFVFKNFWDDLICLGFHLGSITNCNSLSPGACERLKNLDTKREEVAKMVNETLETQIEWAVLNATDEDAITNLQIIEQALELVTDSNIRLMSILKAVSVIEETDDIYDAATDNVTETRIRFQIDMEQYLNGITAILQSEGSAIESIKQHDFVAFALMTALPLVTLHTGHIFTSIRQATLSRKQGYQIVDFVGGPQSRIRLAYNPSGRLYVVQDGTELGKLKVLHSVTDSGNVGRFWKFMTPSGQLAVTTQFLESIDFERAKKIAWLQQNDPAYLDTLKQKGYVSAFLSRTDALSTSEIDDWVTKAKALDQDAFYKYDPDLPADQLPKQLRLGVDILDPKDVTVLKSYNRLKSFHPDLLSSLDKSGTTAKFLENSKTLTDAEFDDYAAKVKAAQVELPDSNLKNFDWDVPAKKVTFTQNIKNGWSSFRNYNLFNWRGRQVKVSNVLTMGTVGGSLNVALCITLTAESTKDVESRIKEIDEKLDTAKKDVAQKKSDLDALLVDEKVLFYKIKNNTVSLYNLFSTTDDSIASDASCQDTLCTFLRDAAGIEVITNFLSTWNNDTVTSSNILLSQMVFMAALEASKTEMNDMYNSALVTVNVMNWVTDGLTLDRMLENAVTLNLDARLPDKYSVLTIIKAAFPSRTDYDGIPLSCIGATITTQVELDAFLAAAEPITGDVVKDIQTGVIFSIGVDGIVGMIASKISMGILPAQPCNGNACGRDEVLKVIAAQKPLLTIYDGVDLASYRSNASC